MTATEVEERAEAHFRIVRKVFPLWWSTRDAEDGTWVLTARIYATRDPRGGWWMTVCQACDEDGTDLRKPSVEEVASLPEAWAAGERMAEATWAALVADHDNPEMRALASLSGLNLTGGAP